MSRKFPSGVITGNLLKELFQYAKEYKFAIPAVNIINSSTINAAMETASLVNSPIILQISFGGACFNTGKINNNNNQLLATYGAKLLAIHIHELSKLYNATVIINTDHCSKKNINWIDELINLNKIYYHKYNKTLFSSHMLDLSEESLNENVNICKKYLKIFKKLNILLEIELGITGGEEDGVDNTDIKKSKFYTNPYDVLYAYKNLSKISSNFIIAAAFGNVHGVYHPGNVILNPEILNNTQKYIEKKLNTKKNPINFVFHGGSGSSINDIKKAIEYGVVKINIDTDLQYAYMKGVKNFFNIHEDCLINQIGNSKNSKEPNKKYYDPRVWLREGEISFKNYLIKIFEYINNINRL